MLWGHVAQAALSQNQSNILLKSTLQEVKSQRQSCQYDPLQWCK